VLYLRLIIFSVEGDVSIDSVMLLMTDFMNLKIKPTQSFKDTHRGECSYVYKYLYLYCVSKKLKLACKNNDNNIKTERV
jgi:hypothetical protein